MAPNPRFRFTVKGRTKSVTLDPAKTTLDQKDIKAVKGKGGWTKVYIKENNQWREFNVRNKWLEETLKRPRNKFTTSAKELVKRAWEGETVAGQRFAARRHVEGLYRQAMSKGRRKDAKLFREVLKKGDKAVQQFWEDWVADHSDEEIKDYFDNSPTKQIRGGPKWNVD